MIVVAMVGDVFNELGMLDKYEKLHMKYPPPRWEYRFIKGKRVASLIEEKDEKIEPNSDLNEDDASEDNSEVIDEQFKQDADVILMEPAQILDNCESMEPAIDV
ncbi:hypothetical protein Lal_00028597 [Lupinus albus]|nr:hypothetical protein Lal_00028597 [Lupinus albus]